MAYSMVINQFDSAQQAKEGFGGLGYSHLLVPKTAFLEYGLVQME